MELVRAAMGLPPKRYWLDAKPIGRALAFENGRYQWIG